MDETRCAIRRARGEDAPILSTLALRSKAYWGYSDAFIEACRTELTYTAQQIEAERFYFAVAEVDGTRIGFYALKWLSSAEVELEALFVEPSHIGKGYGRALIEHARCRAAERGASCMIIQGDPHAERFYRAAGGVLIGERPSASIRGRYLPTFRIALDGSYARPRHRRVAGAFEGAPSAGVRLTRAASPVARTDGSCRLAPRACVQRTCGDEPAGAGTAGRRPR